MKLKIRKNNLKNKEKNFLNNQNYILGKKEKKKILIKYFLELSKNKIKLFFKKFNKFFLSEKMFFAFVGITFILIVSIPIYLISKFSYNGLYLFSLNIDILLIVFILMPFLLFVLYLLCYFIFKNKILNKIFYPFFIIFMLLNFLYSTIFIFIFLK